MAIGIVLGNLGTPESASPTDVGIYLKQFLMDPLVIDIAYPLRWLLVNGIIVPFRSPKSAKAYQKIWRQDGSPLLVYSQKLQSALQREMGEGYKVSLGMRYGNPSIASALKELKNCSEIIWVPLYPQYAESSYQTWVDEAERARKDLGITASISQTCPFYSQEPYVKAQAEVLKEALNGKNYDHLLMSYHGLPISHIKKLDQTNTHCLINQNCCEQITAVNALCYRAQCYETSRTLAKHLNLSKDNYTVSFQSGLSKKWIKPATDQIIEELVANGVQHLAVTMPAFTADCLETLEEIGMALRDKFLSLGGKEFYLVPCLNDHPEWVQALKQMIVSELNVRKH